MTSKQELDPHVLSLSDAGDFGEIGPTPANGQDDIWSVIDDRLRGRWRIAIAIGVVLGAGLAPLGYFTAKPQFESTGLIRVAPALSHVLRETEETRLLPHYAQFVQTQARLIESRRVLDKAVRYEALSRVGWAQRSDAVDVLAAGLDVEADRSSQLIVVSFEGDDADVARTAVNSVIQAYDEIYGSIDGKEVGQKEDTLRKRRTELSRVLRQKRVDMQTVINEFGGGDLDESLSEKVRRLGQVRQEIAAIDIALATGPDEDPASISAAALNITEQQLDALDPTLADLRRRYQESRVQFEQIRMRFGEKSMPYRRAHEEFQTLHNLLQERQEMLIRQIEATGGTAMAASGGDPNTLLTPGQMMSRRAALTMFETQLEDETRTTSDARLEVATIQADIEQLQRDIGEVEQRLKELAIETDRDRPGRITIAASGDMPVSASKDRRVPFAAAGFVGGLGLSLGFFFMLGTIDRRTYRVAQLRRTIDTGRCLGVLPELGQKLADPESQDVAAHCVHRIRNLIETIRRDSPTHSLAVTSPFQGDGKTSVVLSLGFSYAAASHKTLLIDCDLVGRSLTRQVGLLGLPGLREALAGGDAESMVVPLSHDHLSVLPVGADTSFGPESIRRGDLSALLERLRGQFDTIIIDTGPVLGSLESIPVAAASDAVVLVMRRGRQRARLDECIQYLQSVGATCLGVVLNCAARSDCNRYVSEASLVRSMPGDDDRARDSVGAGSRIVVSRESALVNAMKNSSNRNDGSGELRAAS